VLGGVAALASALVPFGLAVALCSGAPQWRADTALVRGLGLAIAPGAGAVSSLLLQGARLLPLGPLPFRASLLAALALGLVGFLLFSLTRRVLAELGASRLDGLIALLASLTATVSPLLLREGTGGGGSSVATALGLAALLVWRGENREQKRTWLAVGAALGLVLVESPATALVIGGALLVQGFFARPVAGDRAVALGIVGVLGVGLVAAVPAVIRPLVPSSWLDLGLSQGIDDLRALDVASLRARGLGVWIGNVGFSAFILTWIGLGVGLVRREARWIVAPLVVPLALDILLPTRRSGVLTPDSLAALRGLSLGAASITAAVATRAVALALHRSKLSLARPAAALVVAYHGALVAISAEEGLARVDHSGNVGTVAWTDQALEKLPPSSLLLVHSEAVAWRLWAARLASGMRPDVTVVPLPLLGRGKLASALIAEEPAILPLLRDVSATGAPGEFGLSTVADARPLFVELDPRWDRRLASHVVSDRLWLRFAPQPYGPSDRKMAQNHDTTTFFTVVGASRRVEPNDEATLEILGAHAREQALASALVGDKESVQRALAQLTTLRRDPASDDPLWDTLDPSRKVDPRARGKRAQHR
jgi:hypothetical protein